MKTPTTELLRASLLAASGSLCGCLFVPAPARGATPPPGWYRVSVERAIIATSKLEGTFWDLGLAGSEAPDTYVQILFHEQRYRTPVVQNSYQPMWVGSFDALLGFEPGPATVRLLLWDRDLITDDPIGDVSIDLYQIISAGGSAVLQGFGQVKELSISVEYAGPPGAELDFQAAR